ncbi:hypothetical protein GPECTOR_26g590 [Gonium pectorale]|uniref:Uncharacterized protein n=1 Tax=Gonium pectorale TaxID=33097 RepID=A0A150GFQ6_GONPE|nr:hypothetical protein GPECTOR_26g590 [Gonium pectorale]|eukprot:KXZ48687.1 hypothetical protein GPECTOR_26g590 [Gonium pectorale]
MDQFRRFTSQGQKDCKVVLSSKDGTKLGWFLVDVRAAKLQAQYKKAEADDGPFRHFALTVDVRTFQSSKRLPLSSASVYVQAVLPAELIELVVGSGFRLPSRLAPLCSHPAVDIPRGAEGAIPNGYGTLEFTAGVVQLARVLAQEPRISVEAWHKERFRADMLLGAGTVPLTPLLQAEEARWRSELREREAQRMMVLESEWRRRERAREAELTTLKAEYLALEDKAQQVLAAAESRERRILAAEEALLRRRKELEREHSSRMLEAEAAVRRLQVECEHQLDIERDRNAELVRRVAMMEERLAASEARCLAVENEFADYRAASRSTPEAELTRQLAEAREAAKAAEVRAAKAAKAKQGYKEQVCWNAYFTNQE